MYRLINIYHCREIPPAVCLLWAGRVEMQFAPFQDGMPQPGNHPGWWFFWGFFGQAAGCGVKKDGMNPSPVISGRLWRGINRQPD